MRKLCVLFAVLLLSGIIIASCNNKDGAKEKEFKQQIDSLISENDSLREEKGKIIDIILTHEKVEITEIAGINFSDLNEVEKIKNYSKIPADTLDNLIKTVRGINF
ncbi:MAG: hypothetical protein ACLU3W_17440 [Bacteroides ovatus]|jgi:lipoprotein